jgi:hypothetical protein
MCRSGSTAGLSRETPIAITSAFAMASSSHLRELRCRWWTGPADYRPLARPFAGGDHRTLCAPRQRPAPPGVGSDSRAHRRCVGREEGGIGDAAQASTRSTWADLVGRCPLSLQQRQKSGRAATSVVCHNRTCASQHVLFDHLVGAGEERRWHVNGVPPLRRTQAEIKETQHRAQHHNFHDP